MFLNDDKKNLNKYHLGQSEEDYSIHCWKKKKWFYFFIVYK